jgi:ABC-2 type transport system ATP-binding protein
VITHGKLIALGRPAELRRQFEGQRVAIAGNSFQPGWLQELERLPGIEGALVREHAIEITLAQGAVVAPIVRWLVEHGADVEEVRRGHATLEDVYLGFTERVE